MRSVISALLPGGAPQNAASGRRGGLGFQPSAMLGRPSGERLMRSMAEVSTLFAIVNRLANSTASVEWNLYEKSSTGEKKDRKIVPSHAALDLWRKPNKHYTRMRFIETEQQHLDLTGESAWVIVKVGRLPIELWPVRPDRLEPIPSKTDFLAGYIYTAAGEQVPLSCDQVIRPMMPNPMDPYRGLGPVQALLTHLDATRYSAEWNRNFFANSAEPGGIVEVPYKLDDVEFDEFRQRWAEQHKGTQNAHRVAILEDGFAWKGNTYTRRDMQFAELDTLGREVIREGFGFPKAMLGAVEDVNRANAEAGEVVFGRWLIVPRLERKKDHLNNELLPMYGEGSASNLEFDYVPPVPEDRQADNEALLAQSTAFATLVAAGVEPDYAAALVGMPPVRMAPKPEPAPVAAPGADPNQDPGQDDPQKQTAPAQKKSSTPEDS